MSSKQKIWVQFFIFRYDRIFLFWIIRVSMFILERWLVIKFKGKLSIFERIKNKKND